MPSKLEFYDNPVSMEPLFPDDTSGKLEKVALELLKKASKLSGSLNPNTIKAVSEFLRPMNSYYSNLIEGHDTHPIDIARALNNDYSEDKTKKNLQIEAFAHIQLKKIIEEEIKNIKNPYASDYIESIHRRFYNYLPEIFKTVTTKEGIEKNVIPGKIRTDEVEVGRHIAPFSESVPAFMQRFEEYYNPNNKSNSSQIKRIISIAAAHHRLAWIHPFLDGNGRVVRLLSDASFIYEDLDAKGLWSISRGLARNNYAYRAALANADLKRLNDYDGRGNLSNKMLIDFCEFFLNISIDQVEFMTDLLDLEHMTERIERFVDLMVLKKMMKPEAKYILINVFLKGKISKVEAMQITNTSDKTLKNLTDSLIKLNLLEAKKEGINMFYYVKYPIEFSPFLFPNLYPSSKDAEMLSQI
jgi:Fic family protein